MRKNPNNGGSFLEEGSVFWFISTIGGIKEEGLGGIEGLEGMV